jgi:hypothetical protein
MNVPLGVMTSYHHEHAARFGPVLRLVNVIVGAGVDMSNSALKSNTFISGDITAGTAVVFKILKKQRHSVQSAFGFIAPTIGINWGYLVSSYYGQAPSVNCVPATGASSSVSSTGS